MATNLNLSTNYKTAANWLNGSLILCNDITNVDSSVLDNFRFNYYDDESDEYTEIYQYYLTSYSLDDVRFLEDHFGLLFSYSNDLDLYVLCVDHWGTSWDYVYCSTDLENAARELGE